MPESRSLPTRTFDDNIGILLDEILLAEQWKRPSLLLAVHRSSHGREKAEKALVGRLEAAGLKSARIVFGESRSDISQLVGTLGEDAHTVLFISNLDWAGGDNREAYRGLNMHRELFVERALKVVVWLTTSEAANLPRYAPDFWAFRHRVVEFISQRSSRKAYLPVGVLAWDMTASPDPFDGPRNGIRAREDLLGRLPDTMEAFSARLELHWGIGYLHWVLGENESAGKRFEAGLALARKHPLPDAMASLTNGAGIISYENGDLEQALERFKQGLRFRSSSRILLLNESATQCAIGRTQEAFTLGKRAVRSSPTEADTWRRLGYIYHAAGRTDEAISCLTKAVELQPRSYAHHEALAVLYGQVDRKTEARAQLALASEAAHNDQADYRRILEEALLGDVEAALTRLVECISRGTIMRHDARRDPNFAIVFDAEDLTVVLAAV